MLIIDDMQYNKNCIKLHHGVFVGDPVDGDFVGDPVGFELATPGSA